jgi:tetratricopeptide (TPR) repeat protein
MFIGECYENSENYTTALEYYEKAIKLDGELSDAWVGKAVAYDALGKTRDALGFVKVGLNLDPDRGTFWFILGDLQLKLDLYDEAEESYKKVLEIEPENVEIWVFLTNLLIDRGKKQEALDTIALSLKYHVAEPRLMLQRAEILMLNGNEKEALSIVQMAFALDSELFKNKSDELPTLSANAEIRQLITWYGTNN